ncbi:protein arginine N-methyltransferase 2 [Anomaloglossus baeobatrachus]|uniref:protein arginine N-methyltransferase 2 n=1 Tax=Anomaloglossus baeobatrachus TaxID=238106 RepID=UPI003F5051AC
MEKEESEQENKDTGPPEEDMKKSHGVHSMGNHENTKPFSPHNVSEMDIEPLMRVVREMERELSAAKSCDIEARGDGNSSDGRLEEIKPGTGGHEHTRRNRESHNQDEEGEAHLFSSETIGIDNEPDIGDYVGITKKIVRDPFICKCREDLGFADCNLQRDLRAECEEGNLQGDQRAECEEGNLQGDQRAECEEGNLQGDQRAECEEGNLQRDLRAECEEGNLQRAECEEGNLQRDLRAQCEEGNLQRDLRTRQFVYNELKGNLCDIENEDLAGEGGMDPNEGLPQAWSLKEYKAGRSCEKPPGASCLAASCSIADYPYVDFSTNEYIVMCDFAAAEDTQLSLSQGDKVSLLSAVTAEWWWVEHKGQCGYVPATHLRGVHDEEDSDIDDPWQDEEYYGSYRTLKLHLEMLSDQPRTETYRNVIIQNSKALKGKRILDLGCGTGIISFFCAQLAEPEIVYAVEASDIAEQTQKLVDDNGYSSIIQVQCHRAEDLQLPTKVDVLVSEWMGTCLLFEFMLESVLSARDLWLEEDGVMWPSTARVHLVPCSADQEYEERVLFWDSPYGLDFSALKPMAIQEFFSKPKPDYVVKPEDCLSQPCTLLDVNMKTLNVEDLEKMSTEFNFHVDRDGTFHGFTAWFSVQFQNLDNQEQVELDTGPFNQLTHWKHTLFMLDQPTQVYIGDRIAGSAVFQRNPIWRRHLSVTITWSITRSSVRTVEGGCKVFPIWR